MINVKTPSPGKEEEFTEINALQEYLQQQENQPVAFELKRGRQIIEKTITTQKLSQTDKYGIGIALSKSGIVSYPVPIAFVEATKKTYLKSRSFQL